MSEKTETPTMKKVGKKIVLGTDTVVIPFKYDLAGRMISRASDTFAFDADGNQVSAVEENIGSRFSWSSDNRLLRVEKDIPCSKHFRRKCNLCPKIVTLSEGYAYLPLDWRRVFRKTDDRTYVSVFDGDDESHEYLVKEDRDHRWWKCLKHKKCNCLPPKPQKRLDLIREFIGGPGTDDLEVTKFHGRALSFLKDALGSTIALANRGGNPVARIAYDVWGNMRWPDKPGHGVKPCRDEDLDELLDRFDFGRSFGFDHDPWHYGRFFGKALTPYLYAGRRLDSFTGQYFNRNRYYQPKYGRFISRDPIGFNGGLNLWNYAGCNPLLLTDSFGEGVDKPGDLVPGAEALCRPEEKCYRDFDSAADTANELYESAVHPKFGKTPTPAEKALKKRKERMREAYKDFVDCMNQHCVPREKWDKLRIGEILVKALHFVEIP